MQDLIEFLNDRIDYDERLARSAIGDCDPQRAGSWEVERIVDSGRIADVDGNVVVYDEGSPDPAEAAHIARWGPARVLAEIDLKRRVIARHAPENDGLHYVYCKACSTPQVGAYEPFPCDDVKDQAVPYAGHPDFEEAWRP